MEKLASNPGVKEAAGRNPNSHKALNGAPDGPSAHFLGHSDDGGMSGDVSVKGKNGASFHFK